MLRLGGPGRNFVLIFGTEKTRMVWPHNGEKSLLISAAVSTQYWRVTDGQTDGQTYGSRGKTSSSRMTFSRCNYQFLFEKTSSEFHRSVWYIQYETMKPSC